MNSLLFSAQHMRRVPLYRVGDFMVPHNGKLPSFLLEAQKKSSLGHKSSRPRSLITFSHYAPLEVSPAQLDEISFQPGLWAVDSLSSSQPVTAAQTVEPRFVEEIDSNTATAVAEFSSRPTEDPQSQKPVQDTSLDIDRVPKSCSMRHTAFDPLLVKVQLREAASVNAMRHLYLEVAYAFDADLSVSPHSPADATALTHHANVRLSQCFDWQQEMRRQMWCRPCLFLSLWTSTLYRKRYTVGQNEQIIA